MIKEINGKLLDNEQNKEIYLISDFSEQDLKHFVLLDALVLDYNYPQACLEFIRKIRSSFIESIYLLPVYILSINSKVDSYTQSLSDGIINSVQAEPIAFYTDKLRKKRDNLVPISTNDPRLRILNKVLRFLYTRESNLTPVVYAGFPLGYIYPVLSEHFQGTEILSMFDLLKFARDKDYLRQRFIDKLHLCNNCYSAFINYRETCPKCGSFDLFTQNLIHHFVCAYIGPESDFIREENLVCPKCNKILRHIGVDYDKPSMVYTCNNCRNIFQEPLMNTFCFHCTKEGVVEQLIDQEIYTYELTEIGRDIAQGGVKQEERSEIVMPGFVSFATFTTFLKFEVERNKASNSMSSIGSIMLNLTSADRDKLGSKMNHLIREISEFLRKNTLSTEILSFTTNNSFLIISPDNEPATLEINLSNLLVSIHKLLISNLPYSEIQPSLIVQAIEGRTSHIELINMMLSK